VLTASDVMQGARSQTQHCKAPITVQVSIKGEPSSLLWSIQNFISDDTIYRIVSNIAILRPHSGISLSR